MKRTAGSVLAVAVLALPGVSAAHQPSDAFLALHVRGPVVEGRWDIALRDLDDAVGLDGDGDGAVTWGELRARRADVEAYALSRLRIGSDDEACSRRLTGLEVASHSDGAYAVVRFAATCPREPSSLKVAYDLFLDFDAQHRGLLRVKQGGRTRAAIFGPADRRHVIELGETGSPGGFVAFAREGVWHIWIGFDHILFLVALLLPAVLRRERGGWQPAPGFRPALWEVLRIVTAFTVAHSVTLSLAALGVVRLPSRAVETAIAASVLLAAVNNLYPVFQTRRWAVAFALGLLHGFGFSSVLADLGLPRADLLGALVGFNLGVEVGQVAIVAAFLPVAFALRRSWVYRRLTLVGGSIAIAIVAGAWSFERIFSVSLLGS